MELGISIIICCHNSEKRIPKVLDYLNKQVDIDNIDWEILVIDNASNDNTVAITVDYAKTSGLPIKVVSESRIGLSYARITGINAAKYEFICYVDDDNWLCDEYVSIVYDIMKSNDQIGLLGGYGSPAFDSEPPIWFEDYQEAYATGPQAVEEGMMRNHINHLYGAGLTLRKSVWHKLIQCGFTYKLTGRSGKSLSSGEDSELCLATQMAGYKLWYEPSLKFIHFMPDQRLSYNYLKALHKAFGKSDVILALYSSEFQYINPLKRKIIKSYFLCLFYNLYFLSKTWFTTLGKDSDMKMKNELLLNRVASRIGEHLRMFGNYSRLRDSIHELNKNLNKL